MAKNRKPRLTVKAVIEIAKVAHRAARLIGHRLKLDEVTLEQQGYSSKQIDEIFKGFEDPFGK